MLKIKKLNSRGMTLLEVMLSIFLIVVTFVLFQSSINAILLNRDVKNRDLAFRIAQTKIESLRNTPFASLPTSGSFNDPLLSSLKNGAGTLTVTDSGTNTKTVTATVTWTNIYSGVGKSASLSTIITQGGL